MSENYFPRANADSNNHHEPIATTEWVSDKQVFEHFALGGDAQNPIIFGKTTGEDGKEYLLAHDDDAHLVTIAGSRSGKGTSLIIPNLLNYSGPAIVVDPKGENANVTAKWREEELMQNVFVLDPFGETKFKSNSLNPLLFLNPKSPEFMDDITDLADALIVKSNANDPHWDESARSMVKMILKYIAMDHKPAYRNLKWLRKLLLVGQSKTEGPDYKQTVFKFDDDVSEDERVQVAQEQLTKDQEPSFIQFLINIKDHEDDFISGTAQRFLQAGEKEFGSIVSTTQRNTEFLDSELICNTISESDFNLSSIREGATIYLVLPEMRLAGQSRWLRLMLTVFIRHLQIDKREVETDPSVLILIDECATLGYMEIIERATGYIAGFGVKIWSIWQDLSQLKKNYKDSWETFIGNAGMITAFGNVDLTTREYLSKYLGKCETPRIEENYTGGSSNSENRAGMKQMIESPLAAMDSGGNQGTSTTYNYKPSYVISPLLHPEEVGRYFNKMTKRVLVLIAEWQPICAGRITYFEDEPFMELADENPLYKE